MGGTEVIGIGSVAIALFGAFTGIMYKISVDHRKAYTDLTNKVIDVVEKNAAAFTGLQDSVRANTKVTESTNQSFNELLKELLRGKGNG